MNSLILEIHTNHVSTVIIHLLYLLSFQQSSHCNNFLLVHLWSLWITEWGEKKRRKRRWVWLSVWWSHWWGIYLCLVSKMLSCVCVCTCAHVCVCPWMFASWGGENLAASAECVCLILKNSLIRKANLCWFIWSLVTKITEHKHARAQAKLKEEKLFLLQRTQFTNKPSLVVFLLAFSLRHITPSWAIHKKPHPTPGIGRLFYNLKTQPQFHVRGRTFRA